MYSQTIDDFYENLEEDNSIKKIKILILFDDMMTDMKSKKKNSYCYSIVFTRKKSQNFTRFYVRILFESAKNYKMKRNTLFYHENTKQKSTSKDSIESFES